MTPNFSRRTVLAMTLVCAFAFGACSASGNDASQAGAQQAKNTLTIALDREIPTLDTTHSLIGQQPILVLSNALYQPLMTPGEAGAIVPNMATSLTAQGNTATWKLTIPAKVTFSDNSPLTTTEVKAHIKRLADPKTGSASAGQAAQIMEMEIKNPTTMIFKLKAPNADFPSLFARGLGMVTSTKAKDTFGFPLGAGPYVVEKFVAGHSATLKRNPHYWGKPAKIERLVFKMMPDADARFQSLKSHDVDLMWTEVTSQFQQARNDKELAVFASPSAVSTVQLNLKNPKFKDLAVRKALAQAIDRKAINATVNLGEGTVVDSPYALLGELAPRTEYPKYDAEAARKVLAEHKLSFAITVENRPDTIQRATAVKDMLHKAGVEVEIKPVESASFVATLKSGKFEAADLVTSVFSDPSGAALMVTSKGPYNFTGYANQKVDKSIGLANQLTEPAQRAPQLTEVAKTLNSEFPILWLTASHAGFIGSSQLTGLPDLKKRTLVSVQPADISWTKK